MNRLHGCRCLITGASRGLGAAIARRYWSEGADLVLAARDQAALDDVAASLPARVGQRAHAVAADLERTDAPATLIAEAIRLLGGVSVLVNNAAIQGPIGELCATDATGWERTFRVNLFAAVELCRHAVPVMSRDGHGRIINISGGGATGPRPHVSAYGAAKAVLVRFSETLAVEVDSLGITVNCVAPGAMASRMTDELVAAGPERSGAEECSRAAAVQARGADGAADRAAGLCAFLASSDSAGISGKLISAVWDPWETLASHRSDLQGSDVYTLRRVVPADRGLAWGAS